MLLSLLVWLPLVGALVLGFWPAAADTRRLRSLALAISGLHLLLSLGLTLRFDPAQAGLQMVEFVPWFASIGWHYSLGIDGLSLPLVILSSLLVWIAVLTSRGEIERPRLYFGLLLVAGTGLAGCFLAQNLLLFFLFYELELLPFYLLIFLWGASARRGYAAMKFLIYTAVSGFMILSAFMGVTLLSGAASFELTAEKTYGLPLVAQLVLLTMLLVGFGIKMPLVPLHTWLPEAYGEASPPVAILLGGALAKLGTYGLVRFGLQLFPDTWALVAPGLALIGSVSAVYGALSAIAQTDIKKMIAYSSIGHMGYVIVAAAAATPLSLLGATLQMVAHGLILALLFHLAGLIEQKVGSRELAKLSGLMNPARGLPTVSALLVLAGMASAGIPGLVGFVAEFAALQGSFARFPVPTLICVVCSGFTAVYFVILLSRTCFGRLDNATAYYPAVRWGERGPALLLTVLVILFGLQPGWLARWSSTTAVRLAEPVQQAFKQSPPAIASAIAPTREIAP